MPSSSCRRLSCSRSRAPVEDSAAGAGRQIEQVRERSMRLALGDQSIDRLDPDAADRGERIADRRPLRPVLDREVGAAMVDVRRPQADPVGTRSALPATEEAGTVIGVGSDVTE